MPIPDPEAVVIAYLKDTPSVSSWVDGRIYGYELDVDADETWLPCIVTAKASLKSRKPTSTRVNTLLESSQ